MGARLRSRVLLESSQGATTNGMTTTITSNPLLLCSTTDTNNPTTVIETVDCEQLYTKPDIRVSVAFATTAVLWAATTISSAFAVHVPRLRAAGLLCIASLITLLQAAFYFFITKPTPRKWESGLSSLFTAVAAVAYSCAMGGFGSYKILGYISLCFAAVVVGVSCVVVVHHRKSSTVAGFPFCTLLFMMCLGWLGMSLHYWTPFYDVFPAPSNSTPRVEYSSMTHMTRTGTCSASLLLLMISMHVAYTWHILLGSIFMGLSIVVDGVNSSPPRGSYFFVIGDCCIFLFFVAISYYYKRDREAVPEQPRPFSIRESVEAFNKTHSQGDTTGGQTPLSITLLAESPCEYCAAVSSSKVCQSCETSIAAAVSAASLLTLLAQYPAQCPYVKDAVLLHFTWEVAEMHPEHLCTHLVTCPRCKQLVPQNAFAEHQRGCTAGELCPMCDCFIDGEVDHFNSCTEIPIPCPLGCNIEIARSSMSQHTAYHCEKRHELQCPAGCGAVFGNIQERLSHVSRCLAQPVPCPAKCGMSVAALSLGDHLYDNCIKRVVVCGNGCGQKILMHKRSEHAEICNMRPLKCPQGCGTLVPLLEMASHVEAHCSVGTNCPACNVFIKGDLTPHFLVCRLIKNIGATCPQGCSEELDTSLEPSTRLAVHFETCIMTRIPCPKKCRSTVAKKNLFIHCSSSCKNRITGCITCGYSSSAETLQQHSSVCANRTQPCGNCGMQFKKSEIVEHVTLCKNRLMKCTTCSELVAASQYTMHYLLCGSGDRLCPSGCEKVIPANNLKEHVLQCNRKLECPLDCGEFIDLSDLPQHCISKCRSRYDTCVNGCGKAFKLNEQVVHNASCSQVVLPCSFDCGAVLPYNLLVPHVNACMNRYILCPNKCGEVIVASNLLQHASHCARGGNKAPCIWGCGAVGVSVASHFPFCEQAEVVCYQCKETVPRIKMQFHLWKTCVGRIATCQYNCGYFCTASELPKHYARCPNTAVPCLLGCGAILPSREDAHRHSLSLCPKSQRACNACKGVMESSFMVTHMVSCPWPGSSCPNGCGATLTNSSHGLACPDRLVQCEKCSEVVQVSKIAMHKEVSCADRMITCGDCGEEVLARKTPEHMWKCKGKKVMCPLACGAKLTDYNMQEHMSSCGNLSYPCKAGCGNWVSPNELHDCSGVVEGAHPCPYGCGETVERGALPAHFAVVCENFLVPCKLGCGLSLPRNRYVEHVIKYCDKRALQCLWCEGVVAAHKMQAHRNGCAEKPSPCKKGCGVNVYDEDHSDCSVRSIECPLGCGEVVPLRQLQVHSIVCANMSFAGGMIDCVLGCGTNVPLVRWDAHLRECRNEHIECHEGCGLMVKRCSMAAHLAEICMHRQVTCLNGCGDILSFSSQATHDEVCKMKPIMCLHPTCEVEVPRYSLLAHLKKCAHLPKPCPEGCGAVVESSSLEAHALTCSAMDKGECAQRCTVLGCGDAAGSLHVTCPLEVRPCFNGCEVAVMTRDMARHCQEVCRFRAVRCTSCGDPVGLEGHPAGELCSERFVACPLGCKTSIKWTMLSLHTNRYCSLRVIECYNKCGKSFTASDEEAHMLVCENQPVSCQYCNKVFPARAEHGKTCGERPAFCQYCKQGMTAGELPDHLQDVCKSVPRKCEFCPIVLPEDDMKIHTVVCESRTSCPDCGAMLKGTPLVVHKEMDCGVTLVTCAACGDKVTRDDTQHDEVCKKGMTSCTMCGVEFVRDALPAHEERCKQVQVNNMKFKELKPFLGISTITYRRHETDMGALVTKVKEDSVAFENGVTEGSLVLSINAVSVTSKEGFKLALRDSCAFQDVNVQCVPKQAVDALQGSRGGASEHASALRASARQLTLLLGTVPSISMVEYYACLNKITFFCARTLHSMFSEGGSQQITSSGVARMCGRLGIPPPTETMGVGVTFPHFLTWLANNDYLERAEIYASHERKGENFLLQG
eukprot:TRINITY_DN18512_c1_g1_i1.p1 TRINITY_DN18512_c1_g1~~TRINITY_DN18512_c1_g1_i1.p1  ORF type:complete len:1945 (+),score=253.58 TRINITY_DN18512_c1_g1_i1:2-5836(+)